MATGAGSSTFGNNAFICARYRRAMTLDIGTATIRAAAVARDTIVATKGRTDERGMAAVAGQALFAEALLGAVKARVAELKAVSK